MGMCGAETIRDLQQAEMIVAPAIKTEGKQLQLSGRCSLGPTDDRRVPAFGDLCTTCIQSKWIERECCEGGE